MTNLGDPTSYLELEPGTPVLTSDGREIGTVAHVLADDATNIFDGLIVKTEEGHRFADAPLVERLHEGAAVLQVDAAAAGRLPEPAENPAVLGTDPDDITPDALPDKLRRAWDWVSGNY
jgi:sporulation protein YlmC with PRC-barrel domain